MILLILIGLGLVSAGGTILSGTIKARKEEKEIRENDEKFFEESLIEYERNLELEKQKEKNDKVPDVKDIDKQTKVERDTPIVEETINKTVSKPAAELKSDIQVKKDADIQSTLESIMKFRKALYSSDAPNQDTLRMIDKTIFDLSKGLQENASSSDRYRAEELSNKFKTLNASTSKNNIDDLLANKSRLFIGKKQDEYALASAKLFMNTKKISANDIDQEHLNVIKMKDVIKSKTVDGIDDLRSIVDETNKTLERYKIALMNSDSKFLDRNIRKINTLQHTLDRVKKDTIDYDSLESAADFLKLFTESTPENLEQKVEELYKEKSELRGQGHSASYLNYANNKLDAEIILLKSLYYKHTKKVTNLYVKPKFRGSSDRGDRDANMTMHREFKDKSGLVSSSIKRSKLPLVSPLPKLPTEIKYTSNIENRYLDGSSDKFFKNLFNEKPGSKASASNKNDFSR